MDMNTLIPAILGASTLTPIGKSLGKALYEKLNMLMLPSQAAQDLLIEHYKNTDDPPELKAFKIKNVAKILKESDNQYDIYKIAQDDLDTHPEQDHSENVDAEWLSRFMNSCKHVCSDDIKLIWGKLLAEECMKPDSVPTRLVHILSNLDRQSAQAFFTICNLCLEDSELHFTPVIFHKQDFFRNLGLSFIILSELDSIGLIRFAPTVQHAISSDDPLITEYEHDFIYNSSIYSVKSNKSLIRIGDVLLTEAGQALCRIIPRQVNSEFEALIPTLFKDYTVTKAKIPVIPNH